MTETPALKSRLQQPRILTVPGIFDALSALLAEQAGFEAAFLSGSAVAYSQLGRPDVGLVTVNEMADVCARITDRVAMPILADVDSGFGNAAHAARAIRMLEQAGAAGVQVEDQVPVKRANDLKGRPLICPDAMVDKIKAMADARRSDSMLISARTDSSASESLEITLERILLYKAAGADLVFAEGLPSSSALSAVVEAADGTPVVYNLLVTGKELTTAGQLEALGVSLALFPGQAILAYASAVQTALRALKADPRLPEAGHPIELKDINAVLGTPELLKHYQDVVG